ncbi:MAG: TIGR03619 family F420-dependent LLM class oxidoreductase [Nitrososphaeraceae archaeon]
MKIGIVAPQFGQPASRENIVQTAKDAEQEDLDSLWVAERLLWPLNPQTPYPGSSDGSLPVESQNVLDPLETLTYIAANTNKIILGTSVIDMLFHNPVILAKRFATLDALSEGRIVAGLGIGWSRDEYQVSNVPFSNRGKRADEFIQVLKKIWTDDVVEFKGEYYNIPASIIGPKPIQKPHIPLYLGGFSPHTFTRIIKYDTNGWLGGIGGPLEHLENAMKMIKENANSANKDQKNFQVTLLTFPDIVNSDRRAINEKGQRPPLTGTIDEIGHDVKRIKDIGINHIIFGFNFSPIGANIDSIIEITKELSKFAR